MTSVTTAPTPPEPPPTPDDVSAARTAKARSRFVGDVILSLAGDIGGQKAGCSQPFAGWWDIFKDGTRAFHEATHVIIGLRVCGLDPLFATVEPCRGADDKKFGGIAVFGSTTHVPAAGEPLTFEAGIDTDRAAAKACYALAIIQPPYGWQSAVRIYHQLRAETIRQVNQHWAEIVVLARELSIRRTLRAEEIAAVLAGEVTPPVRGERI